ncbi:hypothetical protein RJ639_032092 [Escallonia herrerae]|uniref:Uncharacterized protein n=1 Tax=Escallonia herrerae TaxID=1293975 RepID=A0AA88X882_9ASTE|nr:hypothetical protein RJ639_032092 [Escallonia herrerae]
MEVLNPNIASSPQTFFRVSIFSPKCLINVHRKKALTPNFKSPLCPPFSRYSPLSTSKEFRISAKFSQFTNRRQNSLRKKLTKQPQQEQVRGSPIISDPSSNFENPVDKSDDIENPVRDSAENVEESDNLNKLKSESLRGSVLLNQLESWADQYKKDLEFWGAGSGPILTVYQDADGKVRRVDVNEDEILRRSNIEPSLYKQNELEDEELAEVNSKISYARVLARDVESGSNVIPQNSSVANFVASGEHSRFIDAIRGVTQRPGLFTRASRVGIAMLCGFFVFGALNSFFTGGEGKTDKPEYSSLEKEMMRRKLKARMEKEMSVKDSVEVLQDSVQPQVVPTERPPLHNKDLMESILKAKASSDKLVLQDAHAIRSTDFDDKIQEIRAMARRAREIERTDPLPSNTDREENQSETKWSHEEEAIQQHEDGSWTSQNDLPSGYSVEVGDLGATSGLVSEVTSVETTGRERSNTLKEKVPNDSERKTRDMRYIENGLSTSDSTEVTQTSKTDIGSCNSSNNAGRAKPRVIRSVKEAREYLSLKVDKGEQYQGPQVATVQEVDATFILPGEEKTGDCTTQVDKEDNFIELPMFNGRPDSINAKSFANVTDTANINSKAAEEGYPVLDLEGSFSSTEAGPSVLGLPKDGRMEDNSGNSSMEYSARHATVAFGDPNAKTEETIASKNDNAEDVTGRYGISDVPVAGESLDLGVAGDSSDLGSRDRTEDALPSANKENWMEKNFHEFEPIVEKIGAGFRDNYLVAKERVNQELEFTSDMIRPTDDEDDGEIDWMKDDRLKEIVFQVRENELMGRDPFYLMDAEDKLAFFEGLEKKVEKENEKLQKLHQYLHSNIENLDYGADGISLYDSPEKIIPRWKGPQVDTNPEFLNDFIEQRKTVKTLVAENLRNLANADGQQSLQESEESPSNDISSAVYTPNRGTKDGDMKTPRTVIQRSDGTARAGKKSGKEYWQHTKKWSRGFLESYNAETDPEVKAVMKDIGKDLDRWITEKEIQEAAVLMDKLPERGRKIIDDKLKKVKREMELYGPQAVMSKYSEYAEEKEEDYLWWLDLPFVLCIELYTIQDEDQKVGFYSLEMAEDLELDPKQYHVIAFEDTGDCKNMCHIIQSHMEMLGNGNAFVVAQPPKDAFREAKANGFSVTVIRKGELRLNVDQTLEEVEEQITEIGSKIYHDKMMQQRSVDINSLMKGVFGIKKPTKSCSFALAPTLRRPTFLLMPTSDVLSTRAPAVFALRLRCLDVEYSGPRFQDVCPDSRPD